MDKYFENNVEEDGTPTQKIWQPVADLQAEHIEALKYLQQALTRGDLEVAGAAELEIARIEREQAQVHAAARKYILAKLCGG